jgi:type VI secretion system protein ImpK
MTASATPVRHAENLALFYQEVLTATVRLRGDRQSVPDPAAFRYHTRDALKAAANQALAAGYTAEDVKLATFAAVAFLDEAILNSKNSIFADWLKKPLQEELFGTHVAGDLIFQNLQQLLERPDSPELADLLEVYLLCLLLGFVGRYSSSPGEVKRMKDLVLQKMKRIRGRFEPIAPVSVPPHERVISRQDPWVRRLAIAAVASLILVIALFTSYKIILKAPISALNNMAVQAGK